MNMKKTGKLLSLLLALCTLALCACTITYPEDTPTDTRQPTVTEPTLRGTVLSHISDYAVIYPTKATDGEKNAAMQIINAIDSTRRADVDFVTGDIPKNNREILIGNTNRAASKAAIAALDKDRDFSVSFNKDEVVIAAKTDAALADAVAYFLGTVLTADISHYSVGTVDTHLYNYPLSGFFGLSLDALKISYATKEMLPVATSLQTYIHDVTGADVAIALGGSGNIRLSLDETMERAKYRVEPAGGLVTLRGGTVLALSEAVRAITSKSLGGAAVTLDGESTIPLTMKDIKSGKEMQLVWFDEFDGSALNSAYWSLTDRMYGNSKITTTANKKNFEVADGDATMRVWKSGDVFTTNSTLTTMNRMSFRYGYLEIYAKVPTTSGTFPSFWLQSAEQHRADKSMMTEVDVFEIYTKNKMECTLHKWEMNESGGSSHHCWNDPKVKVYSDADWSTLSTDYHLYGFGWTETEMYFTVDGKLYATFDITDKGDFCQGVGKVEYDKEGNAISSLTGMSCFRDALFINFNNWIHTEGSFRDRNWKTGDSTEYPIDYSIAWIRLYQDETGTLYDDLNGKISDGIK